MAITVLPSNSCDINTGKQKLALDSWNYCSGEQARQPNIRKIPQSSLYSWTIVHKTKQK